MRLFATILSLFFSVFSIQAQCNFSPLGIGTFDGANYSAWLLSSVVNSTQLGTYQQEDVVVKSGTHSVKIDVTTAHNWGMRFFNNCNHILKQDSIYEIRFWVNGGAGKTIKVALQDNSGAQPFIIKEQSVLINGNGWNEYLVPIQSTGNFTRGKVKFTFPEVGTYYVDDITIEEKSPEAATFIKPNDSKIKFSGVVDAIKDDSKVEFYRFPKNYALSNTALTDPFVQWTNSKRACGSSGISVEFKTNSKNIKVFFTENIVNTQEDNEKLAFGIYKNGVLHDQQTFNNNDVAVSILNPSGDFNIWRITLPAIAQVDFTGLEIDASAILNDFPLDNRKVYVAIGNSITQGVGQENASTHLTFPWQVADSLGFQLYNWGIAGSKINELVFDNFASSGITPNVVTVLWGYNDFNSNSDSYIINNTLVYYKNLMTKLSMNYPNAIIVGILPTFSNSEDRSEIRSLNYIRNEQEKILQDLMLSNNNICYFNGADYTNASHLSDDVHLKNSGATVVANKIIEEILNKSLIDLSTKQITVHRSEYEKIGDVMIDLRDESEGYVNYTITQGNTDSYFNINSTNGVITVNKQFPDVANQVDSIVLMVKVGVRTYKVKIVDAFDYFIATHPEYVRLNNPAQADFKPNNPYTVFHNIWGRGNAGVDQDFRMSSLVHPNSPDSTIFIWDTPGKAEMFNGASVWCYLNVLWGNRHDLRTDLPNFPIRVGDLESLDFEFDVEQIFGTQSFKIAANQFFTNESSVVPFRNNQGDFFMVFDQVGNFMPDYADYFSDTTILGKTFAMMHDSTGTMNLKGYQLRRAIIKNNDLLMSGKIDLKNIFNSFTSRGFLNEDLYFPNIQFGIEVTDGWGAIRLNKLEFTPKNNVVTHNNLLDINNRVFPNPAKELLYLGDEIVSYSLLNLQGQLIQSGVDNKINVHTINPGMYILKIKGKSHKIIIE